VRVSAKAPCRVDLAGATLDIWPLYLFHDNVVTVNFAVDRYTYCDIETRDDSRIVLRSRDLAKKRRSSRSTILYAAKRYRLPLPALLVRFLRARAGV
jgi:D-glycero-alpha-D-manno-heptose-7-phosphate kinase